MPQKLLMPTSISCTRVAQQWRVAKRDGDPYQNDEILLRQWPSGWTPALARERRLDRLATTEMSTPTYDGARAEARDQSLAKRRSERNVGLAVSPNAVR